MSSLSPWHDLPTSDMPRSNTPPSLKQRTDYTHKHNTSLGRHGWLRPTPAYSLKIVEEILKDVPRSALVLDPFCGTATTALCAAQKGNCAATTEINPFLVWFGEAKLAHYSPHDVDQAIEVAQQATACLAVNRIQPAPSPPIHNINRWWTQMLFRFCAYSEQPLTRVKRANGQRLCLTWPFAEH